MSIMLRKYRKDMKKIFEIMSRDYRTTKGYDQYRRSVLRLTTCMAKVVRPFIALHKLESRCMLYQLTLTEEQEIMLTLMLPDDLLLEERDDIKWFEGWGHADYEPNTL